MRVLITMLGRSVRGMVNSTWASMREFDYVPGRVHIITFMDNGENTLKAVESLRVVLQAFGSQAEIFIEPVMGRDMGSISIKVRELLERYRESGDRIAIDVTSGTKDLVLGSIANDLGGIDHIFYLRIDSLWNADRPYILIPVERQRMIDVLAEVRP